MPLGDPVTVTYATGKSAVPDVGGQIVVLTPNPEWWGEGPNLDQLIIQGETDGWRDERLIPLVAGLSELLPWVEQWHHEPDDFYGGESAASVVRQQLDERMQQVERTREQLAAWRPQPARRGRRATK